MNEERVLDARQVGYAFLDMTEKESQTASTGVIFKISVICGCQLPTHDAHINALESEFLIFLKDFGFGSLTIEEVLLAFRMNATFKLRERVEVYGAIFNIDYAAKVLRLYMEERIRLDSKLSERHRDIETETTLEEEANKRRVKIMQEYDRFLQGVEDLDLKDFYMQLSDDGAFIDRKFDETFLPVQYGYHANPMTRLEDWGKRLETRFAAGRQAVMVLFKAMRDSGKGKIYSDDLKLLHPGFYLPEKEELPIQPEF